MPKRIEKIVDKQVDSNQDAVNAITDKYLKSFDCIKAANEKEISEANLNIQKILSDIANRNSDEVIEDVLDNFRAISDLNADQQLIEAAKSYLLEEIKERVTIQGLNSK